MYVLFFCGRIVALMAECVTMCLQDTFVSRLDHFFDAGYYLAGNEPSFQTPIGYHYANHPTKSVDRVREVVFTNFDISAFQFPFR